MAFDSPRIAELRRRVQADPSSIAFAQLAEEHRRAGDYDEAVRVCRAGLERHPGYLSARVTLGRALIELGQLDDAELEFDLVLGTAADNLAAIRGVAEIHKRRGDLQSALDHYRSALAGPIPEAAAGDGHAEPEAPATPAPAPTAAPALFDFDELLEALGQPASTPAPPQVEAWLSPFSSEADTSVVAASAPPAHTGTSASHAAPALHPAEQTALDELERWLEVLEEARGNSPAA